MVTDPAIFLIPNSIAGSAERALFESGFQTIVLRENELSVDALSSLLSPLWSAGFVVLIAVTQVSSEMRRMLEAVGGDALVEFADVAPNFNGNELLEQILSHAKSLRVGGAALFPGEGD